MKNQTQLSVTTFSRGVFQTMEKIKNYLVSTENGATPKMIASNTRLNVNTIKSILPKMQNIKRVTRGWYIIELGGDTPLNQPLLSWTFHNLVMTVQLPKTPPLTRSFSFGLIDCDLTISKSYNATFRVSCDYPLNVSSICMVFAFLAQLLQQITSTTITPKETIINTIEFNKDYSHLRLEGIKAITLDNLLTHFKIYQKELTLRKEHKTKHRFNTENIIDMLTQNPNDLELAHRLEAQQKQLTKLVGITTTNYQLVTKLIERLNK